MTKRPGRPKLKAKERRGEILRFVVTKEEADAIRTKAKAARQTLSEYLRSRALQEGE